MSTSSHRREHVHGDQRLWRPDPIRPSWWSSVFYSSQSIGKLTSWLGLCMLLLLSGWSRLTEARSPKIGQLCLCVFNIPCVFPCVPVCLFFILCVSCVLVCWAFMCLTDTVSLCEMYPVSLCPYVKLIIDFQLPYCYLSLELLQHPIFVCNSNTLLLCFMLSLFWKYWWTHSLLLVWWQIVKCVIFHANNSSRFSVFYTS